MFRSLSCLVLLCSTVLTTPAQQALQTPPKSTLAPSPLPPLPHPTLDRIRNNHAISCGVVKEEEDYSRTEDHGNRAAFDIDLCTAVAVATLGPGAKLVVKSYPDEPFALRALRAGEVDVVATASLSVRNTAQDLAFSPPILLDGQGVLFPNNPAVKSPSDLAGKKMCFLTGSAAEEGLHRYAAAHGITFVWYPFSEAGEMEAAFFTSNCDAVTSDLTQLANIRAIDTRRSHEFTILPETIRPDALAVASWAGDPRFSAIVFWTIQALLGAEELGITRDKVGALAESGGAGEKAFLGQRFGTGAQLGLRDRWVAEVIAATGNYGEIFDRDLGAGSPLQLPRGNNRLAPASGGQLSVIPFGDQ